MSVQVTPGSVFTNHFSRTRFCEFDFDLPYVLTLKAPLTNIVGFAASVDQDQASQNVQPDLRSTLSAMLEHYKQKMCRNLIISFSYPASVYPSL